MTWGCWPCSAGRSTTTTRGQLARSRQRPAPWLPRPVSRCSAPGRRRPRLPPSVSSDRVASALARALRGFVGASNSTAEPADRSKRLPLQPALCPCTACVRSSAVGPALGACRGSAGARTSGVWWCRAEVTRSGVADRPGPGCHRAERRGRWDDLDTWRGSACSRCSLPPAERMTTPLRIRTRPRSTMLTSRSVCPGTTSRRSAGPTGCAGTRCGWWIRQSARPTCAS
jgi:hypothetical protein